MLKKAACFLAAAYSCSPARYAIQVDLYLLELVG